MFLSLLNRKEMLKFLDLAIYMVDIDGEATDVEKRVFSRVAKRAVNRNTL